MDAIPTAVEAMLERPTWSLRGTMNLARALGMDVELVRRARVDGEGITC